MPEIKLSFQIPYVNIAEQHAPIKAELLAAISRVIDEGKFILGEDVQVFEQKFAQLCGVRYAVGVNSGTDAIIYALKALGIKAGDEVITVSNTFVSTVSSIIAVGAKPVLVDVGEDYLIDTTLIEKAITSRTKAILPVHLTGSPADMDSIMKIAKKYQLSVVEDCAQSVVAEYKGIKVGAIGDVGCFSLHPLKTLSACGDGGVITTNNPELYEKFIYLRDNGFRSRSDCVMWSNNSRLDTIQAAMLLVKLNYLEQWTESRRKKANYYQNNLKGIPQVRFPKEKTTQMSVYHTFVIQAQRRNELMVHLAENGVETKIHYPVPVHLQPVAKDLGYNLGSLPRTESQMKEILSLPVYPELTQEDQNYIIKCIREFYQKKGETKL